jgi:hypothetical protein
VKIYINKNYEIKAINSTTNTSLIETEVNREETFGDMTDFMILNYCYKEDENGYSIYPASNYSKLVEEDYKIKIDESRTKIFKLEDEQVQQNNEILVNMLANTEIFEMILGMMPVEINLNSKGVNPMVEVYATLIIKGIKSIEDVPLVLREQVIERLKQLEVPVK